MVNTKQGIAILVGLALAAWWGSEAIPFVQRPNPELAKAGDVATAFLAVYGAAIAGGTVLGVRLFRTRGHRP